MLIENKVGNVMAAQEPINIYNTIKAQFDDFNNQLFDEQQQPKLLELTEYQKLMQQLALLSAECKTILFTSLKKSDKTKASKALRLPNITDLNPAISTADPASSNSAIKAHIDSVLTIFKYALEAKLEFNPSEQSLILKLQQAKIKALNKYQDILRKQAAPKPKKAKKKVEYDKAFTSAENIGHVTATADTADNAVETALTQWQQYLEHGAKHAVLNARNSGRTRKLQATDDAATFCYDEQGKVIAVSGKAPNRSGTKELYTASSLVNGAPYVIGTRTLGGRTNIVWYANTTLVTPDIAAAKKRWVDTYSPEAATVTSSAEPHYVIESVHTTIHQYDTDKLTHPGQEEQSATTSKGSKPHKGLESKKIEGRSIHVATKGTAHTSFDIRDANSTDKSRMQLTPKIEVIQDSSGQYRARCGAQTYNTLVRKHDAWQNTAGKKSKKSHTLNPKAAAKRDKSGHMPTTQREIINLLMNSEYYHQSINLINQFIFIGKLMQDQKVDYHKACEQITSKLAQARMTQLELEATLVPMDTDISSPPPSPKARVDRAFNEISLDFIRRGGGLFGSCESLSLSDLDNEANNMRARATGSAEAATAELGTTMTEENYHSL